jgi:hypothetical protein
MKEQELSSIFIYFNGNSRYYLKSESIVRKKKIVLPTVQRMAFISVEDLKIERMASGSNAD